MKKYGINASFNHTDNTISFSTSDEINSGLDLESLMQSKYYLFVKITYSNSDIKYYSLKNASEYENTTYYAMTKKNKIDINFSNYNEIPYMGINVVTADSLPEEVYDIVIDPSHGGLDKGGVSGDYTEAGIVLDCGLKLKSKLEDLGLKVFISRDENSSPKEDTANNMYDENGRINVINKAKAKLAISLHINENTYNKNKGGVEVYAPSNSDLEFASILAENIVEKANTYYSEQKSFKKSDGVYVRNFTNADISAYEKKAQKAGYEPYNIDKSTPYLYLIRETGGICTNAFVDGRNTKYGANKYYKSNVGTESYVIQLGFMKVEEDLNNIINNEDSYMEAIAQAIKLYYNL